MMTKRYTAYVIFSVFFIFLLTGCALAATGGTSGISTKDNSWNSSTEILITENAGKDLQEYPVAVVLNSSNFNFSEAKIDGSDLRFSSENRTLNYWIETWDPENEEALIWVRLTSLSANQTTKILMRYGNPVAEAVSSGEKKLLTILMILRAITLTNLTGMLKVREEDWSRLKTGSVTSRLPRSMPMIHPRSTAKKVLRSILYLWSKE
ncbi:DUF2341 domain-containing protein [Methanosarcina barkeri]|uniref:DUF2341 domain-containing protein n=1 Tax=Methanosarcina barkeri TaxID=2208 RepID=UPI000B1B7423|nr:DUF2341 domain-containing protein [Methanosarcina barkeri]